MVGVEVGSNVISVGAKDPFVSPIGNVAEITLEEQDGRNNAKVAINRNLYRGVFHSLGLWFSFSYNDIRHKFHECANDANWV
jgi:hypothetical protein